MNNLKAIPSHIYAAFGIGVLFILITYTQMPQLSAEQSQWPRVQGLIVDSWYEYGDPNVHHKHATPGKGDAERERRKRFEYVVDGVKYDRHENHSGDIGDYLYLRYPPGHPEYAITEPDPETIGWASAGIGIGALMILISAVISVLTLVNGAPPSWATVEAPEGKQQLQ